MVRAKKMYKQYYRDSSSDFKYHPDIAWCYMIFSDYYLRLNFLYQAKKYFFKGLLYFE